MSDDLVTVGRVVKAHGLHGEVAVNLLSDVPGRLDVGVAVHVGGRPAVVATSRPHQGRLLIRFEGVDDRTAAEQLRGRTIEAEPVDLGDTETYFVHELVDLPVLLDDDHELGIVVASIELPDTAGYDLLEVRRADGSTWLLPAVDDYVDVRDDGDAGRRLVVTDPPDGLLDDSDLPPGAGAGA